MANPTRSQAIIGAGAIAGALVAIWGGISSVARPLLDSDGAPLASVERVAELKNETVKTFGSIQSQSRTDSLATAASLCGLFRKLAADAEARRVKSPTSPQAIDDAQFNDGQRDYWCNKMSGH